MSEGRSTPDFLFPGTLEYKDSGFDASLLTMLGVKSTCKDRWRQVLSEANRIEYKHLLTLETAISSHQTGEMQNQNLQLVLPKGLHNTYTPLQQAWLLDISTFTNIVREKQNRIGIM